MAFGHTTFDHKLCCLVIRHLVTRDRALQFNHNLFINVESNNNFTDTFFTRVIVQSVWDAAFGHAITSDNSKTSAQQFTY